MAETPGSPVRWQLAAIPDGADLDGAVCELWVHEDGLVTAEVRIPGRQDGHD